MANKATTVAGEYTEKTHTNQDPVILAGILGRFVVFALKSYTQPAMNK